MHDNAGGLKQVGGWGAEGVPKQREALPAAEGGAKRRPARPPEKC